MSNEKFFAEGISLERAIELLTANVKEISDVEGVSLIESVGRVAAENYFATFDNPPFDRSPLDGYALKSSDTPRRLKVIGEECAGDFFSGEIKSGECLRIMTGAAMPKGSEGRDTRRRKYFCPVPTQTP